jgi:uncharacterized protein (DUF58 family)
MPFVPGRSLILALVLPVLLAVTTLVQPELWRGLLFVDGLIVALALLDALLARRPKVSVTRSAPHTASLARPMRIELQIESHSARRLRVRVNDTIFPDGQAEELPIELTVAPRGRVAAHYRLTAMQRGSKELGDIYVRYPSPLGFWWRQLQLPASAKIRVYPDVQAVRHYELLARQNRDVFSSRATRLKGGDTEFERLRDYNPDDEFRRIDWKATARRRRFTVREFQLEKNQNVVFLLDCGRFMTAVWDDHTALDYSLNATLMLSHVAARRGDQVGLLAFDEEVKRFLKPRAGLSAANQIIQATYDLFPRMVESDYEGAFRTLRSRVTKRTLVVFIGHAIDDQTARRIQKLSRELLPRHLPLVVLLKDRDLELRARQAAPDSEAACIQAAAAEIVLWRQRVVSELQSAGVLVLDVFHDQLTGALVSRYLETKAQGLI